MFKNDLNLHGYDCRPGLELLLNIGSQINWIIILSSAHKPSWNVKFLFRTWLRQYYCLHRDAIFNTDAQLMNPNSRVFKSELKHSSYLSEGLSSVISASRMCGRDYGNTTSTTKCSNGRIGLLLLSQPSDICQSWEINGTKTMLSENVSRCKLLSLWVCLWSLSNLLLV